jgi:hypothetical protein
MRPVSSGSPGTPAMLRVHTANPLTVKTRATSRFPTFRPWSCSEPRNTASATSADSASSQVLMEVASLRPDSLRLPPMCRSARTSARAACGRCAKCDAPYAGLGGGREPAPRWGCASGSPAGRLERTGPQVPHIAVVLRPEATFSIDPTGRMLVVANRSSYRCARGD